MGLKISIVGPSFPFRGGVAHYTTCLYRAFVAHFRGGDEGDECRYFAFSRQYPRFLYPGKSDREPAESPYREEEAELVLDGCNPFRWISGVLQIRKWEPDICVIPWWVNYWTPHFFVLLTLLPKGCRKVIICHNSSEHEKSDIGSICRHLVFSRADVVVCHSESERAKVEPQFPDIEFKTCFHPIYDQAVFNFDQEQIENARKVLGGGALLISFGFIRPYKGVDILLRAMPDVLKQKPDCKLLIAGECWGGMLAQLQDLIEELGLSDSVLLKNEYVDDRTLSLWLQVSDLAVFSYRSVTGSGALLTALGHGLPVVASNLGCFQEMIVRDRFGLLCEPVVGELSDSITLGIEQDVLAGLEKQARFAVERYSWKSMVLSILE